MVRWRSPVVLWNARPDTARRCVVGSNSSLTGRKRINCARAKIRQDGGGNVQYALPKRRKRSRRHHPALSYQQIPQFLNDLRAMDGISPLALEFLILNAPRTMETLCARWPEIDDESCLWTIPEERMKAGLEHRIPLTPQSMAILDRARSLGRGEYIFPGRKPGKPLSIGALLELVKPMGYSDAKGRRITVHGFRSTFRDWVAECTSFHPDIAEMALAHVESDEVKAAYMRSDLLQRRRALMEAWAAFCTSSPADNIISFKRPAGPVSSVPH